MKLTVNDKTYDIVIERKSTTRNTYIRVKPDLTVFVTTNRFTTTKAITNLIEENYDKLVRMIEVQEKKKKNNQGFLYLGKQYDIVYVDSNSISFGDTKVFLGKDFDIDKWYKKQAKSIFLEHLDEQYNKFSKRICYPKLKIRKMTSRWGVCNISLETITLNLELIKRNTKYLDYVIVHELSHLIHADHSERFWALVEENMPDYKKYRKEMKEF